MRRVINLWLFATAVLAVDCRSARAEFPALSKALNAPMTKIAEDLTGKSVLVSLQEPHLENVPWRFCSAVETEVVAQLLGHKIQAVDDDTDERFRWLARAEKKSVSRWKKEPIFDVLLVGQFKLRQSSLALTLSAYTPDENAPIAERQIIFKPADADLKANTPTTNQKVLAFVRARLGKQIGNGDCWTAPNEAYKSFGCKRFGIYDWGRELTQGEAILPGDIVQFEKVRLKGKVHRGKGVNLRHHSAVVSDIKGPNVIGVLHQNYGRGDSKKKVSASTFHLNEAIEGTVAFYRPWRDGSDASSFAEADAENVQRIATPVVDRSGRINLLKTIDPKLDAIKVRGIWESWDGPLTCHKESFAKLQIPVDVPKSYILRARIKPPVWDGRLCLSCCSLNVNGRQCLLNMDGYGGKTTGLGMIDGKKEKKNETTQKLELRMLAHRKTRRSTSRFV